MGFLGWWDPFGAGVCGPFCMFPPGELAFGIPLTALLRVMCGAISRVILILLLAVHSRF